MRLSVKSFYPVWPKNEAFPCMIIISNCLIYPHEYVVRQQRFKALCMITLPPEHNLTIYFVSENGGGHCVKISLLYVDTNEQVTIVAGTKRRR
jgi:hypothetical protein